MNQTAKTNTYCNCCDRQINGDGEAEYELRENEGYTGCCNDTTYQAHAPRRSGR